MNEGFKNGVFCGQALALALTEAPPELSFRAQFDRYLDICACSASGYAGRGSRGWGRGFWGGRRGRDVVWGRRGLGRGFEETDWDVVFERRGFFGGDGFGETREGL